MTTFVVQVDWTDRTRRPDGRFHTTMATVHVGADTEADAVCAAVQLVSATRKDGGGMAVAARIVI